MAWAQWRDSLRGIGPSCPRRFGWCPRVCAAPSSPPGWLWETRGSPPGPPAPSGPSDSRPSSTRQAGVPPARLHRGKARQGKAGQGRPAAARRGLHPDELRGRGRVAAGARLPEARAAPTAAPLAPASGGTGTGCEGRGLAAGGADWTRRGQHPAPIGRALPAFRWPPEARRRSLRLGDQAAAAAPGAGRGGSSRRQVEPAPPGGLPDGWARGRRRRRRAGLRGRGAVCLPTVEAEPLWKRPGGSAGAGGGGLGPGRAGLAPIAGRGAVGPGAAGRPGDAGQGGRGRQVRGRRARAASRSRAGAARRPPPRPPAQAWTRCAARGGGSASGPAAGLSRRGEGCGAHGPLSRACPRRPLPRVVRGRRACGDRAAFAVGAGRVPASRVRPLGEGCVLAASVRAAGAFEPPSFVCPRGRPSSPGSGRLGGCSRALW